MKHPIRFCLFFLLGILLAKLKADTLRVPVCREKESTRAAHFITIKDFLSGNTTGILQRYTEEEVQTKTTAIYTHILQAYPTLPSPYYASAAE